MTDQQPALVLAVDGGQSSTLALVAMLDGQILAAGLGGPSNHISEPGGLARLESALHQSISTALENAGRKAQDVISTCLGMTGGIDQAREIAARMLPSSAIQSHADMVTALAGASIGQPGVVVIAGTGAVAYGRGADGRDAKAGGWGYIMGDEGSGYAIGCAAMRAASQASDGRGQPTRLLQSIPAHFDLSSLVELHKMIYASEISRPRIAGLAAVVADDAATGDPIACNILADAGRDLATAALGVITRLDALDSGLPVYTTGGVFGAGDLILKPFETAIKEASPASSVRPSAFSPGIGALLLALQAAGVTLTDDIIRTIRDSLPQTAIAKHQKKET